MSGACFGCVGVVCVGDVRGWGAWLRAADEARCGVCSRGGAAVGNARRNVCCVVLFCAHGRRGRAGSPLSCVDRPRLRHPPRRVAARGAHTWLASKRVWAVRTTTWNHNTPTVPTSSGDEAGKEGWRRPTSGPPLPRPSRTRRPRGVRAWPACERARASARA